jgi:hypothetical protein
MIKKTSIPIPVLVLLTIASFLAGTIWQKSQDNQSDNHNSPRPIFKNFRFQPTKSSTPEIELYFQAFGQKDSQLQTNLVKLVKEFGQQVTWQPHYFFSESSNPDQPTNCLATETGNYYCAPQGKNQLNQNIREICAWRFANNKLQWWEFINSVHQNCRLNEIDTCWQKQAKEADLPNNQIQNCFSTQAIETIKEEIAVLDKKSINQTPVLLINNLQLPLSPTTNQAKNVIKIGNQYFSGEELTSPDYLQSAICASFKDSPELCQ